MSVPNVITIARILTVPLTIWLIVSGRYGLAFWIFIAAGISDGVDGYIAKRFQQTTELGSYLDPLADKLLLVSIYLSLGLSDLVPAWLVILIVSRDVLIIGGVMLAWIVEKPVSMQPLLLSKVNTAVQIVLAGCILAALGFGLVSDSFLVAGYYLVAISTIVSGAQYVRAWGRQMANGERQAL
jgi:cardiolipin synthase